MASTLLMAGGANDLVGTMVNEQVLRQAGSGGESVTLGELAHIAHEAGLRLFLRDTFHRVITEVFIKAPDQFR